MKIYKFYGNRNANDGKHQPIGINVKHSNLQKFITLNVSIKAEHWNFKKRDFKDFQSIGKISVEDREHLSRCKRMFTDLETLFDFEFSKLKQSFTLKSYTIEDWKIWCERVYESFITPRIPIKSKPFNLLWNDYIEKHERIHSNSTIAGYKSKKSAYDDFETYCKKNYMPDEMNDDFYKRLKIYILDNKKWKINTFGDIVKKIKSIANYWERQGIDFHKDLRNFKKEYYTPEYHILKEDEIKKIFTYSGTEKENEIIKIAKILYYGCFRYSEVIYNVKNKSFEDIQNNIEEHIDINNKRIFRWKCHQEKQADSKPFKNLPMHKELHDMITNENAIPKIYSLNSFNTTIPQILSKIGINKKISSHSFRRSYCHFINKKNDIGEVMRFSGHSTEKSCRVYLKQSINEHLPKTNLGYD
jgi:site-specific recombinase XerD